MKNSSFKLIIDEMEADVSVEIPWKVVVYETSKGYEAFPELESLNIKIPKIEDDGEIYDERNLVPFNISDASYEIHSPEVEGDRGVIIRPEAIWLDSETKKAVITFILI